MEDIKYCYNCKYHKELYTFERVYFASIGKGYCAKENKVVGDKYYCEHHTEKNK